MDKSYIRLFKNSTILLIGNASSRMLGLIMLPFYTRWLGTSDYGSTDLINVYSTFLLSIISCCLAEAIFVFPKNKDFSNQQKYFSSSLFCAIILFAICGAIFYIIAEISSYRNIYNSFLSNLWFIYFMMIGSFLQQFLQQFVCCIDKLFIYASTGILLSVLTIAFSFLLIPNYGVYGYISSIIYANIIAAIYSLVLSKAYLYFSLHALSFSHLKEMLHYSIPLIPNNLMWWIVSSINRPLMEGYIGLSAIGIFSVANKFPSVITMLFQVFAVSWQISVFEEFGKANYSLFFNRIFKIIVLFLVLLSILLSVFSHFIVDLFASAEFFDAAKYIPVLSQSVVFACISSFVGCNFSVAKESKYFFYSSLWGTLTAILLNWILIPIYGIWGASIAILCSFIVMTITRVVYSWKYVHIYDFKFYILLFILNLTVIGITLWLKNLLWIYVISGLLLFSYIYYYKEIAFGLLTKILNKFIK